MRRGLSLIEVLVSIALIGVIFIIFTVSLSILGSGRYAENQGIAYGIAEAELETIRTLPSESVTDRADADFIGITPIHSAWDLLEGAQGFLTIEDWDENDGIKQVTAKVQWGDARGEQSIELKTLLSQ